ncbi:MAG: alkaline phosphatase family protein [Coriobacteriia bacterium]|nr:alkaline phosphatase family protein [Coriobacteriia bacterium]
MMHKMAWVAGFVALATCGVAAYAAYVLAGYSWDQVVSYETPFGDYNRPWATPSELPAAEEGTGTPRAVLVIVDGLRLDVTEQMSQLRTLRQYGGDMVATTPQPSLSYPTWTTILSGASPDVSGVTTNWFDGAVPVETVLETALDAGLTVAVSAPEDFVTLYGADRAQGTFFRAWTKEYMSATYVDEAIALSERHNPSLLIVHLPDVDEAGHEFGGASDEYLLAAQLADGEIGRLVGSLQDERTLFIVIADHGHLDRGGHGGWEQEVTHVPALFIGPPATLETGAIDQVDIAPTLAAYLAADIPRHSEGVVRAGLLSPGELADTGASLTHGRAFATRYLTAIGQSTEGVAEAETAVDIAALLSAGRDARLAAERLDRLPIALGLAGGALLAIILLFALSWRGGLAATAGALAYYMVYNGLYFVVRGHHWSLSAFNTESFVQQFFYIRMAEAAFAGLVAAGVAALVYPLLRSNPKGPRERGFLGSWLALGPATVLLVMATLAIQVAWFLWAWGAEVSWRLPDLMWGFKYDLDLTQATALGAAALLAPVVTYLVGRYHPKTRTRPAEES